MERGIPSELVKKIIENWKEEYGATFPLYGNNTVRHDISGSVRPLLSSTEIPHEKILADNSGVSKKTIMRIMSGETAFLNEEVVDRLLTAMGCPEEWYMTLQDFC